LPAVQTLAAELEVSGNVEFLGMLPEAALSGYLRSLDIFVQSSRGETMSTAVMQAMAAGLPVVASDVPGLRNMVADGVTGQLFSVGDADGLARKLEWLARMPEERTRLAAAALAHARAHWSHETMFAAYEALLFRLRGARPPRFRSPSA
jgi:glycosyltransferase involved in cell wall biosynthesis